MTSQPITAEKVTELIYQFIQEGFKDDLNIFKTVRLDRSCERALFQRLRANIGLTKTDLSDLPLSERRLFYELLTQYVMFLTMFGDLKFSSGFLQDSSSSQIGVPLLCYIAEHSWPFPQMLPH